MHVTIQRTGSKVRVPLLRSLLIVIAAVAAVAPVLENAWSQGPEIVARVNGEPVTRTELQRMLADPLEQRQLQQDLGVGDSGSQEVDRLALRKLIHRRLLLQEAGRRNFTVSDKELEDALSTLRGRFQDLKSFGVWMKERGLDDRSLFDTVRAQVLMTKVWAVLAEGARATGDEVQAYYEAHKGDLTIGEEVRLGIIAVKSEAAAQEILAAMKKGQSFSRLARTRSRGLLAAQGGDTGWIDSRTLPPSLQKAVGVLKAGDVAGPLQKGPDEFLIIGLQGRRPLRAKNLTEARSEVERRLLPAKQQETIEAWLAEQEEKSKIELFLQPE